ncbi:peroxisomal assembly protein [Tulasnella sp. 419]|nr:peroxisomal assembly protein [Tulasnella sp. 419]
MSSLFTQLPPLRAPVTTAPSASSSTDTVQIGKKLWDTLTTRAELPDDQTLVLAVFSTQQSRNKTRRSKIGQNDTLNSLLEFDPVICAAALDSQIPVDSITLPGHWGSSYPNLYHDSFSADSSPVHVNLVPIQPVQLTDVFLTALSQESFDYAQSKSLEFEQWLCADGRILRQGEKIIFTPAGAPTSEVPLPASDQLGLMKGSDAEPIASYEYHILMTDPVLQGFAKLGSTDIIVTPGNYPEPITAAKSSNGDSLEDVEVSIEPEDKSDSSDFFEIDEQFLASSVLNSISPVFNLDATSNGKEELVPELTYPTSSYASVKKSPPIFTLRILNRRLDSVEYDGDAEPTVYVSTPELGSIGVFSGDWAIITPKQAIEFRLVRIKSADHLTDSRATRQAFGSPTLLHNLSSYLNASSSPNQPYAASIEITIRPSPFGSSSPSVPTAKAITVARIASPHATQKAYQSLFLHALKQHFQGKRRLLKKRDIIALPISLERAELLGTLDSSDEGGQQKGEDDVDPLDHQLPLSAKSPSGVVYFKITNLEYDILDTTHNMSDSVSSTSDSYAAATLGELGCWIDPAFTRIIQTGLEHSRVPDLYQYFQLNPGHAPFPNHSSKLVAPNSAYEKLKDIIETALLPQAADYDLHISVLLKGSRGIGKQTIARWVAQHLGMHIYELNCFEIVGETDVKTEGTLRARFEQASGCSPCILLLRHIDALARTSQSLETGREPAIIPAFQECLNDLKQAWKLTGFPIIVVATTTDVDRVPVGVLGCFKHEIQFEVPNEPERLDILTSLLQKEPLAPDVSLPSIATQTAALVAGDMVDLVSRAKMASIERALKSSSQQTVTEKDLSSAGIQLTGSDFEVALSKARASYSESIGAPKIPNVSWDDVGGLANVKKDILDTIQLPLEHPELFADGLKKRSGILLYGPPGTGKTLLAKAVATSCSLNFFSVKGPELLNMYIGESEANVRRVFQRARDAKPCVIFFDELDSVAPKRGNHGDSGGVMDRIVSQLLAELDGMSDGKGGTDVFVIGATNRPDLLDSALLRPGRFDRMLYLGVSDTHEAQLKILQALTRKFRLDPSLDLAVIANECPFNYTGADFYALCSDAMLKAMSRKAEEIDTTINKLNQLPPPHKHPHPITPQYYLAEMATEAETDVLVSQSDFRLALQELVPSVSASEMEHYAAVQQKFAKDTINAKKEDAPIPATRKGKGKAVEV